MIKAIHDKFKNTEINPQWTFESSNSKERFTHGYHRYPAKFVPNLVGKLIQYQTKPSDVIADVFAGCGTTLVESKIFGRRSVGIDVNPVAKIITKAKITPLKDKIVKKQFEDLVFKIDNYSPSKKRIRKHDKIDYWFFTEEKNKIEFLYRQILLIEDKNVQVFFLCGLSNILKLCSKWLQTSTKPQIDPRKVPMDPFIAFRRQMGFMIRKNSEFYDHLKKTNHLETKSNIFLRDARKSKLKDKSIDVIITSPPYVTSYEYADIHQLTGYWFEYFSDLPAFRKKFIGTFYSSKQNLDVLGDIASDIVAKLNTVSGKKAREVANYFKDMRKVVQEMHRILRDKGKVCVVIGNTTLSDVKIKSAEVITEYLITEGFAINKIIKRKIPVKHIPTIRDKVSGRFTTLRSKNKKLVYPEEFIIIGVKNEKH